LWTEDYSLKTKVGWSKLIFNFPFLICREDTNALRYDNLPIVSEKLDSLWEGKRE
jgi:hypothetical protein